MYIVYNSYKEELSQPLCTGTVEEEVKDEVVAILLRCKVPILGPIIMLEMHNLSTETAIQK